ncbi:MAG: right-handed parallel beta-helix repeat-containing protein [Lachnotalea sp.]
MKSKKIISFVLATILMVFGIPQFATEAEAATTNYVRAIAQYATIYNVTDYGVDTTGKSDCGADISSLVKSLVKARTDESVPIVIYMPSGKYKLTSPIKLSSTRSLSYNNIHLIAEKDTVVSAGKKMRSLVEIQKNSNVSLLGGKWDGCNKTTYNIKIYNATDITVSECSITRAREKGIHISGSTANVDKIKAYKNGVYGVSLGSNANVTMKNSKVYSNGKYGVVVGSSILHMENGNNKIYKNKSTGVSVSNSSAELYASGNSFTKNGSKGNGHGIGIAAGAYGEITNNVIENNNQCGISVFSKAKAVVTNNSIKNNGRHGIGAAEGITLTAENNTITGNKWHGIMVRDKGTGTITNNVLSKNSVAGLCVEKSSATVDGNTMYKNKSNGIYAVAAKISMSNNKITKNKAFGIYTSDRSKVKVVSGNVIKSNSKGDIDGSGSKVTIGKGNTVKKVIS